MADGANVSVRSTCAYCGVGCGVTLTPDGQGGLDVTGDAAHPANFGKLCSKGSALGDTLSHETRLLYPKVAGAQTSWSAALDLVADRFSETIAAHGPDSVAFYVSGQLLTEDYYVANKLIKGFMGTANIDTNSRLCMASTVGGHKRAFGTDTVPGTYEDIDEADLVVLVGSNLAWCHPVLHQRLLAAQAARGTKIVVIDPRWTASCEGADLHLPVAPGGDVAVFNALLAAIADKGLIDDGFVQHVTGVEAAVAAARSEDLSTTGLDLEDLRTFTDLWCNTGKVVTIFSQGVNQSTSGVDKVNAILNCHLATGKIGKPGCGPLSVTGQPNAMGGREVGGLANMLAAHLDVENPEHRTAVRQFWSAPTMPAAQGLKAVDMFRAVGRGEIKALWIIHTNPAVSMPEADAVRDAIAGCDFVVVSDITEETDTARLAHVLLPAAAWAEKSGTVTNSDRVISRQRAVLPSPGQARPDWDILAAVGRRMGWREAFSYENAAEIFREHAALSGIAGRFGKDFDISDLSSLSTLDYDAMAPTRWPINRRKQGGRFFADGQFFHADGKAKMIPVRWRAPQEMPCPERPFVLNTGRIRDQWHTMTRTALSTKLSAHLAEPFVDIHPEDAASLKIAPADLVALESDHGASILRARITNAQAKGALFAPMHWTGETAPSARIDALIAGHVDPLSGQPESKAAVVSAKRFAAAWYGFAVSRSALFPDARYWARARTEAGWRVELAGDGPVANWETEARRLFDLPEAEAQVMQDPEQRQARIAFWKDGVLEAALFVAPKPVALMRDYLARQPGQDAPGILSGRAPEGLRDPGPTLCACFGVGLNTIVDAVEQAGLCSVEEIGAALQAGTNCGACRPELARILAKAPRLEAAE